MKILTKQWKTLSALSIITLIGLSFTINSPVAANDPGCTNYLQTPIMMGVGDTCAEATADLNDKLEQYAMTTCLNSLCGGISTTITMACHPEGKQICVLGFGSYRCQTGL